MNKTVCLLSLSLDVFVLLKTKHKSYKQYLMKVTEITSPHTAHSSNSSRTVFLEHVDFVFNTIIMIEEVSNISLRFEVFAFLTWHVPTATLELFLISKNMYVSIQWWFIMLNNFHEAKNRTHVHHHLSFIIYHHFNTIRVVWIFLKSVCPDLDLEQDWDSLELLRDFFTVIVSSILCASSSGYFKVKKFLSEFRRLPLPMVWADLKIFFS